MKAPLRTIRPSVVAGAVAGFIFLGIGGRIMMLFVAITLLYCVAVTLAMGRKSVSLRF
jgi:hypothetical protein